MHESYLVVDDDEAFRRILARSLHRQGYIAHTASNEASALAACETFNPTRVILDLKLENSSGLPLIQQIHRICPTANIVVLTGYSSIPTTVEAIKLGALNYLCKPATVADIETAFEACNGDPQIAVAPVPHSVERLEWEHIQRILTENHGNISATARALGMHRRTLQRKLQKRPVRN